MQAPTTNGIETGRRGFLRLAASLLWAGAAGRLFAAPPAGASPTPEMTEGPFYPERFTEQPVTDLLTGPLAAGAAALALAGRVTDTLGAPVAGARVELWQCDARGHYHHSRDRDAADRDPAFRGQGWTRTDADGMYAFATIRPVPYPGRTPHIHFAVSAQAHRRLVTQMFVAGEPGNEKDFLYRWLSPASRERVTARLEGDARAQRARFDLVLAPLS